MTEEETQAELAAKAEVEAKAEAEAQDAKFEESIADLSDEEKEAKRAEKAEKGTLKTDYSAELEKELAISEEGRIKAEKALADKRFKTSEDKRNKNTDVEEEEKPITKAELSSFLAENEQKNKKVIEKQQADTLADRLAGSEDEKKLILAKWENRTFPANYSLEEQIKESYVLANGNKLIAERNEALRALKGKEVVNRDSSEAHIKPMPTKEREVSGDIKTVIGRRGFVFNNQTKQYEKTTANGKRLIYDKKTGAVYPEGHKFA